MLIVVNADSRLRINNISGDRHTHTVRQSLGRGSMDRGDCSASSSTVKWSKCPFFAMKSIFLERLECHFNTQANKNRKKEENFLFASWRNPYELVGGLFICQFLARALARYRSTRTSHTPNLILERAIGLFVTGFVSYKFVRRRLHPQFHIYSLISKIARHRVGLTPFIDALLLLAKLPQ